MGTTTSTVESNDTCSSTLKPYPSDCCRMWNHTVKHKKGQLFDFDAIGYLFLSLVSEVMGESVKSNNLQWAKDGFRLKTDDFHGQAGDQTVSSRFDMHRQAVYDWKHQENGQRKMMIFLDLCFLYAYDKQSGQKLSQKEQVCLPHVCYSRWHAYIPWHQVASNFKRGKYGFGKYTYDQDSPQVRCHDGIYYACYGTAPSLPQTMRLSKAYDREKIDHMSNENDAWEKESDDDKEKGDEADNQDDNQDGNQDDQGDEDDNQDDQRTLKPLGPHPWIYSKKEYHFTKYDPTNSCHLYRRNVEFETKTIKAPLTAIYKSFAPEYHKMALSINKKLLQFCGDYKFLWREETQDVRDKLAVKILRIGEENQRLRAEILMQICKHLTKNENEKSRERCWQLLCMCIRTFPVPDDFKGHLINFVLSNQNAVVKQYTDYILKYVNGIWWGNRDWCRNFSECVKFEKFDPAKGCLRHKKVRCEDAQCQNDVLSMEDMEDEDYVRIETKPIYYSDSSIELRVIVKGKRKSFVDELGEKFRPIHPVTKDAFVTPRKLLYSGHRAMKKWKYVFFSTNCRNYISTVNHYAGIKPISPKHRPSYVSPHFRSCPSVTDFFDKPEVPTVLYMV